MKYTILPPRGPAALTEGYWEANGRGQPPYGVRTCKRKAVWILTFVIFALGFLFILSITTRVFDVKPDQSTSRSSVTSREPLDPRNRSFGAQLGTLLPLCTVVILYWVNVFCCSHTARHLMTRGSPDSISGKVDKMVSARPTLWFHAECYHYETRTRTRTDSNGHTHTETYQEKVVTHRASMDWAYNSCLDLTEYGDVFTRGGVTKLACQRNLVFADDASAKAYESSFRAFCATNTQDMHQVFTRGWKLPHHKKHMLVQSSSGVAGKLVNYRTYFLTSLLFCSGCYRLFLGKVSGRAHIRVIKVVSVSSFISTDNREPASGMERTLVDGSRKRADENSFRSLSTENGLPSFPENLASQPVQQQQQDEVALHVASPDLAPEYSSDSSSNSSVLGDAFF